MCNLHIMMWKLNPQFLWKGLLWIFIFPLVMQRNRSKRVPSPSIKNYYVRLLALFKAYDTQAVMLGWSPSHMVTKTVSGYIFMLGKHLTCFHWSSPCLIYMNSESQCLYLPSKHGSFSHLPDYPVRFQVGPTRSDSSLGWSGDGGGAWGLFPEVSSLYFPIIRDIHLDVSVHQNKCKRKRLCLWL